MMMLEKKCVAAGLKMTGQRRVILKVLEESADHPSVDMVYQRACKVDPSISLATVYRTMGLLDELGLVIKHDFKESFARFEIADSHDKHHHLVDVGGGKVVEFQNPKLEKLIKEIGTELGYDIVDHTIQLYGRKVSKK